MIALIDCNNFFVSCERVFEPTLRDVPVAVLSSNDGCIIARSNEVKALGIPMGAPEFQYREVLARHKVALRSSNFALYTDMSRRVMATIHEDAPSMEVYSVDEAFVDLSGVRNDIQWAESVRDKLYRNTGIPVSIGIGPTRTLAKAASSLAKKRYGVVSFANMSEPQLDYLLGQLASRDVWGIGRGLSEQFAAYGLISAVDVKNMPDKLMRKFNVVARRTILELRGTPAETETGGIRQSMVSTRSFGRPVHKKEELSEALSMHAMKLGLKLRRESLQTRLIVAFISTGSRGGFLHARVHLPVATNSSVELVRAIKNLLEQIYKPGSFYKKAGVMAYQLTRESSQQLMLGTDVAGIDASRQLDSVIDEVNEKWGPHVLKLASEGFKRSWEPKHLLRSKRYTTELNELKLIK